MNTNYNIYQNNGYKNRTEYLQNLAFEYEVPLDVVEMFSDMLGTEEDFDGLVSIIQDYH